MMREVAFRKENPKKEKKTLHTFFLCFKSHYNKQQSRVNQINCSYIITF